MGHMQQSLDRQALKTVTGSGKCIAIVNAIEYNNYMEGVIDYGKDNKFICKT
jgi:hypothetical protein